MKNSHLALGACLVSYTLTAMAYLVPPQLANRHQDQTISTNYRSIFEQFLTQDGEKTIVQKATELIVVTDPKTCVPCKNFAPVLDKLQSMGYNIVEETPAEYRRRPRNTRQRIEGLPTLLFYSGKELVHRSTGTCEPEYITERMIQPK